MFWNGQYIISTRSSHLGFALPRTFLTNCPTPLSGFYSTNVLTRSGTALSNPSTGFTLLGESVKYNPDLQNSEYSYLGIQNRGPSQIIQFIGIILDSEKMEARVPEDKVERIKSALSNFQSRRSTTLQELQSLMGTLNFACKVITPWRPF